MYSPMANRLQVTSRKESNFGKLIASCISRITTLMTCGCSVYLGNPLGCSKGSQRKASFGVPRLSHFQTNGSWNGQNTKHPGSLFVPFNRLCLGYMIRMLKHLYSSNTSRFPLVFCSFSGKVGKTDWEFVPKESRHPELLCTQSMPLISHNMGTPIFQALDSG